jgi:hypothetical protein
MITASLSLRFPADTTSAASTSGLWIIHDTKRAANQFGGKVDRRTPQKGQRDRVYNDSCLGYEGMFKLAWTQPQVKLEDDGGS